MVFNYFSAGINFRRQILTSIPTLKGLNVFYITVSCRHIPADVPVTVEPLLCISPDTRRVIAAFSWLPEQRGAVLRLFLLLHLSAFCTTSRFTGFVSREIKDVQVNYSISTQASLKDTFTNMLFDYNYVYLIRKTL